ncbi:MAG: thioesterase family protein [Spirochaetales bacterium]|nr:thioesterase family protein [Spirochaetales bacterium]
MTIFKLLRQLQTFFIWQEKMRTTACHTVRSYECDSYGHVNNAVYLNYLEYARTEFMRSIGFDYNKCVESGFYLYVTHIDIYYKFSAFLDDKLIIETAPLKTGAVSGTFKQIIKKEDGSICVEAEVSWASVNAKTQRPAKIPDELFVDGLKPETNDISV